MSDALLPCPFCGSKDIGKDGEPGLVCYDCGGAANNAESWNRRAQSDAPAPLPADAPPEDDAPTAAEYTRELTLDEQARRVERIIGREGREDIERKARGQHARYCMRLDPNEERDTCTCGLVAAQPDPLPADAGRLDLSDRPLKNYEGPDGAVPNVGSGHRVGANHATSEEPTHQSREARSVPNASPAPARDAPIPVGERLLMLARSDCRLGDDERATLREAAAALAQRDVPLTSAEQTERIAAVEALHSIADGHTIASAYRDAAKAAIKAFDAVCADRDEWKQQHELLVDVRRHDLAALQAKLDAAQRDVPREPTPNMIDAGVRTLPVPDSSIARMNCREWWIAMHDAAMQEGRNG